MPKSVDMIGRRFSRLLVFEPAVKSNCGRRQWLCRCDCGSVRVVDGGALRSGNSKSCGCWNREVANTGLRTHGHTCGKRESREYRAWRAMKARCYHVTSSSYVNYGGRGITICARWRSSFEALWADMGTCQTGLTLERRDNDKGYSPDNCMWASRSQQTFNQRLRSDNTTGHRGVHWHTTNKRWTASLCLNGKTRHLGSFTTIDGAITAYEAARASILHLEHRPKRPSAVWLGPSR